MNELLLAAQLSRTFGAGRSAVTALASATCSIVAGDRIALTGPSGSGKSTLLHLLAGLDTPSSGSISWPAIGAAHQLRPTAVAVVFQAPSLLPPLDVAENVALPLVLGGADRSTARAEALVALGLLGLETLADKLPEELSGGQSQRVAVARALAGNPRMILADEPTGQLDRLNAAAVIDALTDATARCGAALVVNTHDPAVAERFPIRWAMAAGRLLSPGHDQRSLHRVDPHDQTAR